MRVPVGAAQLEQQQDDGDDVKGGEGHHQGEREDLPDDDFHRLLPLTACRAKLPAGRPADGQRPGRAMLWGGCVPQGPNGSMGNRDPLGRIAVGRNPAHRLTAAGPFDDHHGERTHPTTLADQGIRSPAACDPRGEPVLGLTERQRGHDAGGCGRARRSDDPRGDDMGGGEPVPQIGTSGDTSPSCCTPAPRSPSPRSGRSRAPAPTSKGSSAAWEISWRSSTSTRRPSTPGSRRPLAPLRRICRVRRWTPDSVSVDRAAAREDAT